MVRRATAGCLSCAVRCARRQTASGSASSAIGMASATKVDIPLVIGLPMREEEAGEARRRHRRVKVEEPPHRTECEDGVAAEEGDAEEGTRSCASSPRRLERNRDYEPARPRAESSGAGDIARTF